MPHLLEETFSGPEMNPSLRWFCEPNHWRIETDPARLVVLPDAQTDFWQRTHYGFRADNGHFLYSVVEGDFQMETRVRFRGLHRYDQAGLMVRFSPDCWLKTSMEFEPEEPARLGAVVTRHGYSDWSTQSLPPGADDFTFRVSRTGDTYLVEAQIQGGPLTQIRLAHLDGEGPVQAGAYSCSPTAAGFEANFAYLVIEGR